MIRTMHGGDAKKRREVATWTRAALLVSRTTLGLQLVSVFHGKHFLLGGGAT